LINPRIVFGIIFPVIKSF